MSDSQQEMSERVDSGVRVNLIWLVSCRFEDTGHSNFLSGKPDFDAGELVDIEPTINVWMSDDNAAVVQLAVKIAPQKQPTFEAEVVYAAQYAMAGKDAALSLTDFAWSNGVANLVPFVRAKLAQLTTESRFPTFYLQPMNLVAMREAASSKAGDQRADIRE